jgi:hypothetical protein
VATWGDGVFSAGISDLWLRGPPNCPNWDSRLKLVLTPDCRICVGPEQAAPAELGAWTEDNAALVIREAETVRWFNVHAKQPVLKRLVIGSKVTPAAGVFAAFPQLIGVDMTHSAVTELANQGDFGLFWTCPRVIRVLLPPRLKKVNRYSFYDCKALRVCDLVETVETIEPYAFFNTSLMAVKFGKRVASVGAHAFDSTAITSLDLPDALVSIGASAFANLALESLEMGDVQRAWGTSVFHGLRKAAVRPVEPATVIAQPIRQAQSADPRAMPSIVEAALEPEVQVFAMPQTGLQIRIRGKDVNSRRAIPPELLDIMSGASEASGVRVDGNEQRHAHHAFNGGVLVISPSAPAGG